jgi:hypothetical protein
MKFLTPDGKLAALNALLPREASCAVCFMYFSAFSSVSDIIIISVSSHEKCSMQLWFGSSRDTCFVMIYYYI